MTPVETTVGPSSSDLLRAAVDRSLHALASIGPGLVPEANRIGAVLWTPPRVVVTGRLKAGKSTLVNALLGVPVAETAALEATNVVTVYQDGAPSRAEAVHIDGTRRSVALQHGRSTDYGWPTPEIAYVDRFVPSQAIRDLTLIDTPGLSTLTVDNDRATRRALIDGFEQTKAASVGADAAIFLFDSMPRADEVDFLRQIGFTPLTTLGVLSRADGFGEGALGERDPIEHAHRHAKILAARMAGSCLTVVPIAGLLAETSHTGRLLEDDTRLLAALSHLGPFELMDVLESDDPAPLSTRMRSRLVALVGEYGLVRGREVAGAGAAAFVDWLSQSSGIGTLQQLLHTTLRDFAMLHRGDRILAELENLVYSNIGSRNDIRNIVGNLRSDPGVMPVLLFRALRGMLLVDPESPVVAELTTLIRGRNFAERLELAPDSAHAQIHAAAGDRLARARQRQLSTVTAAEDDALATMVQCYTTIRRLHGGP